MLPPPFAKCSIGVTDAILQRFGAVIDDRIGHGGEATVYALSGERVLRVFHTPHGDIARIASFYDELLIGDPLMDVASAIVFLEVARPAFLPMDTAYLTGRAVRTYGVGFAETMRTYRAYYALRFSNAKTQDGRLYAWCVRTLKTLREY